MAEALWTAEQIVAATGGRLTAAPRSVMTGVAIDSRTLTPGDVFAAIRGEHRDGHEFAAAALARGAALAIVSRPSAAMEAVGPLLIVDDPLLALERMGRSARALSQARIIGVTGSVGKTSTKEMLKLALSRSGLTHASAASFNNQWGVPLSLARLPARAAYGVFEIGMNHAGEITPLTHMVRPHIALITAIAPSHLGHFASLDQIADAKAEIFAGVEPGGYALIHRDTPYFDRLSDAARVAGVAHIVGFGRHDRADARLVRLALHAECSCVTADVMGEPVIYKLGLPGEHMAVNSLGVLAATTLAGADLARGALALAAAVPAKGRGTRLGLQAPGGRIVLIDESYNANPTSMRAALALLAHSAANGSARRVAVLGDMLELGEQGPALHADLADAVAAARVDVLYAAGPLMAKLWDRTRPSARGAYAETAEGLREPLVKDLRAGDVVMVKGSLGSRMSPLVEALKAHFLPLVQDG